MVATVESPTAAGAATTTNRFIWHDLMSTDRDTSLAFFASLFGWTTSEFDMGEMGTYAMLSAGDAPFGGAMRMDPSEGHPSHFIGYIACEDVDEVAANATELGGSVLCPPMEIPDVGRFAILRDPMGAYVSVLNLLPSSPRAPEHDIPFGAISWNELSSDDPEKSGAFYSQLFNWEQKASWVAEMPDYTVFLQGDSMLGGLMKSAHEGMPSSWLFYFNVEDIDASVARVAELGGTLVTEIMPVPSVGRIAIAVDPTGATFALMQDET